MDAQFEQNGKRCHFCCCCCCCDNWDYVESSYSLLDQSIKQSIDQPLSVNHQSHPISPSLHRLKKFFFHNTLIPRGIKSTNNLIVCVLHAVSLKINKYSINQSINDCASNRALFCTTFRVT